MDTDAIEDAVDAAVTAVGSVWPIHSFVTANPLAGFEDRPFDEAVSRAATLLGGRGYPRAATFRTALDEGRIDPGPLAEELDERGYDDDPETLLERLEAAEETRESSGTGDAEVSNFDAERLDRVLTKWLSAFLDEGHAEWAMPNRDAGFYDAFRSVVPHDDEVPDEGLVADLPASPTAAIETALESHPEGRWKSIFEAQFAALPGWTGLLKRRAEDGGAWQSAYPITPTGYLAVRLALADAFGVDVAPRDESDGQAVEASDEIADAFLNVWETTYRDELVERVAAESEARE
ncbi:MAG: putative inorganic carbon transporter subunit DabA, partial [Halorubrum sp.]